MNKLALISKYNTSNFFWNNLERKKQIDSLSVENIIDTYQGFEGNLISFIPVTDLDNKTIQNHVKEHDSRSASLLYLNDENKPADHIDKFVHMGFEYGVCEDDWTIYSSIFNEILFGGCPELTKWFSSLNHYFLFSSKKKVEEYALFHRSLFNDNYDVEEDSNMKVYEVWKYLQ